MTLTLEDMPGNYKDVLMVAYRLHKASIPHELSMTDDGGWCIEIYIPGDMPLGMRQFVLIQDDRSKKDEEGNIEFIRYSKDRYITTTENEDGCFETIRRWWDEYDRP